MHGSGRSTLKKALPPGPAARRDLVANGKQGLRCATLTRSAWSRTAARGCRHKGQVEQSRECCRMSGWHAVSSKPDAEGGSC